MIRVQLTVPSARYVILSRPFGNTLIENPIVCSLHVTNSLLAGTVLWPLLTVHIAHFYCNISLFDWDPDTTSTFSLGSCYIRKPNTESTAKSWNMTLAVAFKTQRLIYSPSFWISKITTNSCYIRLSSKVFGRIVARIYREKRA